MSSQKQNRDGVVWAQRGQYRATVESSPGCGGGPDRDVTHIAPYYWPRIWSRLKVLFNLGPLDFGKKLIRSTSTLEEKLKF